jgi:hypothetical protein
VKSANTTETKDANANATMAVHMVPDVDNVGVYRCFELTCAFCGVANVYFILLSDRTEIGVFFVRR